MLRRKYEMLQFLDGNEQMICPYLPHQRTSSSTPQSSSGHQFTQDKKQCEKQPSRHRIGHKFRNSWGRKDSDQHKSTKKSNSLVIIFCLISAYYHLLILEALLPYRSNYLKHTCYSSKIHFLSDTDLLKKDK